MLEMIREKQKHVQSSYHLQVLGTGLLRAGGTSALPHLPPFLTWYHISFDNSSHWAT